MYKNSVCCEIIKTCPLSCIHCSANSNMKAKEYISFKDMQNIIDNAANDSVETFFISGGEPLLHPQIYEIVEYIKNKNIRPVIYSSGCLVSIDTHEIEPISSDILEKLEKKGLNSIVFSLFSLKSKIHDGKTNTPNSLSVLRKTLANAKNIFKNAVVELSFIPLTDTHNEIDKIVTFTEKNNISKINILKLIQQGRAKYSGLENLSIDNEKIFLDNLTAATADSEIKVEISKLYDCDHYASFEKSPYTAGKNEYFITSKQEILEGRRFRK